MARNRRINNGLINDVMLISLLLFLFSADCQQGGKSRRYGRLEFHFLACHRVHEIQRARMQRQSMYRARLGAILAVADYRMSEVFHVDAYLILSPGVEFEFE